MYNTDESFINNFLSQSKLKTRFALCRSWRFEPVGRPVPDGRSTAGRSAARNGHAGDDALARRDDDRAGAVTARQRPARARRALGRRAHHHAHREPGHAAHAGGPDAAAAHDDAAARHDARRAHERAAAAAAAHDDDAAAADADADADAHVDADADAHVDGRRDADAAPDAHADARHGGGGGCRCDGRFAAPECARLTARPAPLRPAAGPLTAPVAAAATATVRAAARLGQHFRPVRLRARAPVCTSYSQSGPDARDARQSGARALRSTTGAVAANSTIGAPYCK